MNGSSTGSVSLSGINGDNIRIISARNATKKERKNYESNEK